MKGSNETMKRMGESSMKFLKYANRLNLVKGKKKGEEETKKG